MICSHFPNCSKAVPLRLIPQRQRSCKPPCLPDLVFKIRIYSYCLFETSPGLKFWSTNSYEVTSVLWRPPCCGDHHAPTFWQSTIHFLFRCDVCIPKTSIAPTFLKPAVKRSRQSSNVRCVSGRPSVIQYSGSQQFIFLFQYDVRNLGKDKTH